MVLSGHALFFAIIYCMIKTPKFYDYHVYVACSLTHAPKEFWDKVESFKTKLREFCNVLCFLGVNGFPARDIYEWDINQCVRKSDLVVAIADLPSIGLGYEMATQMESRNMPCLIIAHEKSRVSDLVIDTGCPGTEFKRYKELEKDGVELEKEKLEKMLEVTKVKKQKEPA